MAFPPGSAPLIRVCPLPNWWHPAFVAMCEYAERTPCDPPRPPTPLILAGWIYSGDEAKQRQWRGTVAWAEANGCVELAPIPEDGWHEVTDLAEPFSWAEHGEQRFAPRERPSRERIVELRQLLRDHWVGIVGEELGLVTSPIRFTGAKRRRLVVHVVADSRPPWSEWWWLPSRGGNVPAFARLRSAINSSIAPHEVDHVDFYERIPS